MSQKTKNSKLSLFILVVGILLSLIVGFQSYKNLLEKDKLKFNAINKKTVQNIQDRMDTYREVLYSGIGLFKASNNKVDREAWHRFVKELHLNEYYPGIQGVGYSVVLYENELEKNKKQIRAEGFKEYEVHPKGKRDFYTSIIYLEPFEWRNQRAFGYDMYSNEVRRAAMKRAIETTKSSLSGKVRLVQENGQDEQAGFLLYLPLYKENSILSTVQQRYKSIQGFVYSPFRAKDFMLGIINDSFDYIQLKVYDSDVINEENLLFNSNEKNLKTYNGFKQINTINFDGRTWTVEIVALDSFGSGNYLLYSFIIAFIVMIITIFIYLTVKRQQEEFETIFNYSKDGIAIIDLYGNFLKFNSTYEELMKYNQKELLEKSYFNLTAPEDLARTKQMIQTVISTGSIQNFEKTTLAKGNKRIRVNNSVSLLPNKQKILIVAKDVTEIKIIEEQTRLASMGEMIGNIAHQWRQPLSIITVAASGSKLEKELETLTNDTFVDNMNIIIKEANYLSKTIDDFKNFIRGSNELTNCKLSMIIDESVQLTLPALKNNFIKPIFFNIDDDVSIHVNKNQIIQALINIINNAKDALVELEDTTNRLLFIKLTHDDSIVHLEIYDNGNGIDLNIIDRIFEPYFTTKHQSIGTGIGLHMTRKLLIENNVHSFDVYNKEFVYESKKYKGACFSIEFKIDSNIEK